MTRRGNFVETTRHGIRRRQEPPVTRILSFPVHLPRTLVPNRVTPTKEDKTLQEVERKEGSSMKGRCPRRKVKRRGGDGS